MYSILVVLAACAVSFVAGNIPSYIKICKKNDPNIADCIKDSVEQLRAKLTSGIPELNVPAIEPLPLDEIRLRSGPSQAKINANITNVKVWGPSSFQILELKPNVPKHKFIFRVNIPQIYFEGDYDIDMNVLILKYKGQGPITGNFTNYKFDCIMKGNLEKVNGKEYLKFEKFSVRLIIGKSVLHLANLFNGDRVLGKATNDVIQENSDLFVNEIKPVLENSLAQKFTDIANTITTRFSYDELFPES